MKLKPFASPPSNESSASTSGGHIEQIFTTIGNYQVRNIATLMLSLSANVCIYLECDMTKLNRGKKVKLFYSKYYSN